MSQDARSFLSQLSSVVQSGVTTLIWAGDADWICNWFGNQAAAEAVTWASSAAFKAKALASYTVNGVAGGTFKNVGNLSFLRVFGAGHEVPFYRKSRYVLSSLEKWTLTSCELEPQLSLQVFKQTMQKQAISST